MQISDTKELELIFEFENFKIFRFISGRSLIELGKLWRQDCSTGEQKNSHERFQVISKLCS